MSVCADAGFGDVPTLGRTRQAQRACLDTHARCNMRQRRSDLDELELLYAVALREHGPQGRSVRLIGEALTKARAAPELARRMPRPERLEETEADRHSIRSGL